MSTYYKTQGIVVGREDVADSDRMFSVFTKDFGKVEVVGRAIRKMHSKLKGGISLFYLSEFEFVQGKHRKTLTDAFSLEKFKNISESPEKFILASRICELVGEFINGQEADEQIFNLLNETLDKLNAYPARQLVYYYFFWNFVSFLGYAPDLAKVAPDAAAIIKSIIEKRWDTLVLQDIIKETQKSLRQATQAHHVYLLEHTR